MPHKAGKDALLPSGFTNALPPCARQTFRATKDIRDKYVLSRLAWDLGILEELCDLL